MEPSGGRSDVGDPLSRTVQIALIGVIDPSSESVLILDLVTYVREFARRLVLPTIVTEFRLQEAVGPLEVVLGEPLDRLAAPHRR